VTDHHRDAAPRSAGQKATLSLAFLCVIIAVAVSAGLVVYTAWRHDLEDGLFGLAFSVLSTRAVLSWFLWRGSYQPSAFSYQQDRGERKPANDTVS
jgi:hypothetical protein